MDDLTAFLNARYDEAERMARAASMAKPDGEEWHADAEPEVWGPGAGTAVLRANGGPLAMAIGSYAADHIAACDPKHRVADIALKRAILAAHQPEPPSKYGTDVPRCAACLTRRGGWNEDWRADPWPCATVRQLGTEFSGHPGYRDDWRPET